MNTYFIKYILIFLPAFMLVASANAQLNAGAYLDAGKINTYDGAVVKTALLADYQIGKVSMATGGQFDLAGTSPNVFTGFYFQGAYEFAIKKFPLDVQGLFLLNPYSDIIHEWNINFRKYYITGKAQDEYEIEENNSVFEKWNLMYLLGYMLKPRDHHWNVGVTVTNVDYFLINQETNPMINLRGSCAISDPFSIYLETWYKSAGTFNISANTFGYFFRTGVIWKLK